MSKSLASAITAEAAKVSYPLAVATMTIAGITLDDVVKITAILAALISTGYTAWKWWRDAHRGKREHPRKPTVPDDRS